MARRLLILGLVCVALGTLLAGAGPASADAGSVVIVDPRRDSFASATYCTGVQFCEPQNYAAPASSAPLDAGTYTVRVAGLFDYAAPTFSFADAECSTGVNNDLWFRTSRAARPVTPPGGGTPVSVVPDLDLWMGVNAGALADVTWTPVPGSAMAPGLSYPGGYDSSASSPIEAADPACSDIHAYETTITAAAGDLLRFALHDVPGPYGDNLGILVVTITPV